MYKILTIFSFLLCFIINKANSSTIQENNTQKYSANESRSYASNSLLKSGDWFKIKVDTTGIFKLSYDQLKSIGLTNPENVRLYSYGGRQLSYSNSDFNHDDMVEIPIKMETGSNNIFDGNDYILFYAEGPTTWRYDEKLQMFIHQKHCFSNFIYLFLTDGLGAGGKRIQEVDNTGLNETNTTASYDSYSYHEQNINNLTKSGRIWYGQKYVRGESKVFKFNFPDILSSEQANVLSVLAINKELTNQSCYVKISATGTYFDTIQVKQASGDHDNALPFSSRFSIPNPSETIDLKYDFAGSSSDMKYYIDYICVNVRKKLKINRTQFSFCDKSTANTGDICKFNIDNNGKTISVWNTTHAVQPYQLKLSTLNNTSSFKIKADTLHSFIAFDGSDYLSPIIKADDLGAVPNQNLHGIGSYDMVIVTHPLFINEAEELADIHRTNDNLSVLVTQPQQIYNEFSCGTPDVSAIRNLMRMQYDRNPEGQKPRYLLLFGDGSFDNKGLDDKKSNLILTYQNANGLNDVESHVSDDYFGLLDLDEGEIQTDFIPKIYGYLDIGIGRFPVQTIEEAQLMINKVKHYISSSTIGDWRSHICLIADDEDGGIHMNQPEGIDRDIIKVNNPEYNVSKIYLDAYKQISSPSGQSFPDVTEEIYRKVEQGALIIDYVGHGNPRILSKEEVLSENDVRKWKNWEKMPIFVTASCEVGRYDDYTTRTLGEWFILSPEGGGIAALTTTRVVYSSSNHELNKAFFQNVLNPELRLGDVIVRAKNSIAPRFTNHRNFTLLGDPALKLAVPRNKIEVGNINGNFLANSSISNNEQVLYEPGDTIHALSKATIEGLIYDFNGQDVYDNGTLYITIYDKTDTLLTRGQDNKAFSFTIQNKILYKGKASIINGAFKFDFIVPKDINYKFGNGKISLYAKLDSIDAIGYSENIIIGGSTNDFSLDYEGPKIELFMNDYGFKAGGSTNESPVLLAKLSDETGINTTGNGFGHNITAILDGNQDKIFQLNNYYEGNLDEYNSGEVRFPFYDLTPGHHEVSFKVWDIYNNSSEASIEFYVHESKNTIIDKLQNAPNPFFDETAFTFEHNQSNENFDISIKIYDIMGNKVNEINQTNSNSGFKINPIYWNGTGASGSKLPNGLYLYRVEITTPDGEKTNKSSKLMIFK